MFRQYSLRAIEKLTDTFDGFTVGQAILAAASAREYKNESIAEWLFSVSDEDFYTEAEKAIENELEDEV